jgi:hypothetical protein
MSAERDQGSRQKLHVKVTFACRESCVPLSIEIEQSAISVRYDLHH